MRVFEDCLDRKIVVCEATNRHGEEVNTTRRHCESSKKTWQSQEVMTVITPGLLRLPRPLHGVAMTILVTIVFFTSSSYASFSVEPLKLNINLEGKFGTVIVTNQEQKQSFLVDITEDGYESGTKDLSYSPSSFMLMPHKIQIVRIMLKPGLNYNGRNYILHIRTDADNPAIVGRPNGFKIPISISNILPDDLELMRQRDKEEEENRAAEIKKFQLEKLEDLTQIKIAVPIKAVVE